MVMEEMAKPRESHLLIRGAYDRPGEKVKPVLPAVLAAAAGERHVESNRLGFARWLVDPDASADGARDGEPVLADVLRHRHREDGRGLRLAGRVAVASGAARLAGDRVRAHRLGREGAAEDHRDERDVPAVVEGDRRELVQNDPENRLLARGPRTRLPAEMVRDQALAMAGLLVRQGRRAVREAVSAAGPLEGTGRARRYEPGSRRGPLSAQPLHVLEADDAAAEHGELRRVGSRGASWSGRT